MSIKSIRDDDHRTLIPGTEGAFRDPYAGLRVAAEHALTAEGVTSVVFAIPEIEALRDLLAEYDRLWAGQ